VPQPEQGPGGRDNFAADREAVEKLFSFSPENKHVPRANRRFLGRAVRFAVTQGIRQFLDLGTGLPSQGHVHEVVAEIDPGACSMDSAWSSRV
jgi:hypothetical protein